MSFALRNRLIHVNCPRDNYENPAEVIGSQQTAFSTFRSLCPPAAKVASVVGIRKKGRRYKCAWKVPYIRGDNNQIGSEQLVTRHNEFETSEHRNRKKRQTHLSSRHRNGLLNYFRLHYLTACW
jgi:hypothetical protein